MSKQAILKEFEAVLSQQGFAPKFQKDVLRVSILKNNRAIEFAAREDGHLEISIADFSSGSFPTREEGKWAAPQDLQRAFQNMLSRI